MNYISKNINKYLCFLIMFITLTTVAQDANFNLKKYWYLRWRLKNYFMVIGEGSGKSLPAGIRRAYGTDLVNGIYYEGSIKLSFGDAPNYLGTYIGVLATEYKLLSDNNQSTAGTLEELYYALKAVIRLDNCEAQYPWNQQNNILNGACSRGDVPTDFAQTYKNQLNKNLPWFDFDNNKGDPNLEMQINSHADSDDSIAKHWSMMSQDHISSILVGLALVKKYVPDNISYNGFWLTAEAKAITKRFMTYMASSFFKLKYPDGTLIPNDVGGDAWVYAYGFIHAAIYIDPTNISYYLGLMGLNQTILKDIWHGIGSLPSPLGTGSTWIYLNLAAVGNSWNAIPGPSCLGIPVGMNCTQVRIWKHSKYYAWHAYYALLHAVLHNNNCKTTNNKILEDLNTMECSGHWNLDGFQVSPGWATSHKYHSTPVHNEYGDFNNLSARGQYNGLEYMLLFNLYSIYNPNYVNNYYPILAEDAVVSGNVPYMLPFPLPPSYLVAVGAENNHWPVFLGIPQVIHTIRSLESTAIIENKNMSGTYPTTNMQGNIIYVTITMQGNAQANVTYKAGETITLKHGFHAKPGVKFHAYIDPLTCNNSGSNYERYGVFEDDEDDEPENENTTHIPARENHFGIYPNPANGQFKVSYTPHTNEMVRIELMDVTGHILQSWQKESEKDSNMQYEMDVRSLAPGVYMLRVTEGMEMKMAKIVIQ